MKVGSERAVGVHPGKEKAQEYLTFMCKMCDGRQKRLHRQISQCPETGEKTMDTNGIQENLFKLLGFFIVRVVEGMNRFPREMVELPSLEIFKTWMDDAPSNLL